MSLLTAFQIITLAGIGLSLLAIVATEIGDAIVDHQRKSVPVQGASRPMRRAIVVKASIVTAAANQLVNLPKAA